MTLTIELPPELQSKLSAEAARMNLPLPDYVLRLLSNGNAPASAPRTGAELVAYWLAEGLVGTRPDVTNSAEHARKIRAEAERRQRP